MLLSWPFEDNTHFNLIAPDSEEQHQRRRHHEKNLGTTRSEIRLPLELAWELVGIEVPQTLMANSLGRALLVQALGSFAARS